MLGLRYRAGLENRRGRLATRALAWALGYQTRACYLDLQIPQNYQGRIHGFGLLLLALCCGQLKRGLLYLGLMTPLWYTMNPLARAAVMVA